MELAAVAGNHNECVEAGPCLVCRGPHLSSRVLIQRWGSKENTLCSSLFKPHFFEGRCQVTKAKCGWCHYRV
jgi:hypothetical protein